MIIKFAINKQKRKIYNNPVIKKNNGFPTKINSDKNNQTVYDCKYTFTYTYVAFHKLIKMTRSTHTIVYICGIKKRNKIFIKLKILTAYDRVHHMYMLYFSFSSKYDDHVELNYFSFLFNSNLLHLDRT